MTSELSTGPYDVARTPTTMATKAGRDDPGPTQQGAHPECEHAQVAEELPAERPHGAVPHALEGDTGRRSDHVVPDHPERRVLPDVARRIPPETVGKRSLSRPPRHRGKDERRDGEAHPEGREDPQRSGSEERGPPRGAGPALEDQVAGDAEEAVDADPAQDLVQRRPGDVVPGEGERVPHDHQEGQPETQGVQAVATRIQRLVQAQCPSGRPGVLVDTLCRSSRCHVGSPGPLVHLAASHGTSLDGPARDD